MDPLLLMSGTALAARIRDGQTSSREVVEAHIRRIQSVNPTINAVVAERFSAARAEADAADRQLRAAGPEGVGPFHGVPCTIKECFRLTGMPNSAGVVARRGVRAAGDAPTVARLRAAGAIPLGVTNLSELCMWYESDNKVYGRTRNPYDPTRIVGGSSGGEGAIVGAGASPFGLGSDVGGSIRMPAFFNGVFGHKGSSGLVPNIGQHPTAHGDAGRFLSSGPLCRRAEDLMPLLRVLAGPAEGDPASRTIPLGDPGAVLFEGMRVLVAEGDGRFKTQPAVRGAVQAAAGALADLGATVEAFDGTRFRQSTEIWFAMLGAANPHPFRADLFEGQPGAKVRWETLRWLLGRSPYTLPAIALCVIERIGDFVAGDLDAMAETGEALRAELGALLAGNTVLLYPPHPTVAPKHGVPLIRPLNFTFTALFNVMQLPVTQVPIGRSPEGLPVGVQVVGADGQDHRTIAVAQALEAALGGWSPPER